MVGGGGATNNTTHAGDDGSGCGVDPLSHHNDYPILSRQVLGLYWPQVGDERQLLDNNNSSNQQPCYALLRLK
jgi:hypothetical protein